MSLLGSIFGQAKDEKKEGGLFDQSKSAELPDRPQYVPKVRSAKKRSQESEEATDAAAAAEGEDSTKTRKKRKKRKTGEDNDESGTTAKDDDDATEKEDATEEAKDVEASPKEDEEARTIFVGNLPIATTTRRSLANLFKDCGKISSTRIRGVPVMGVKLPPSRAGDQNLVKKVCVNTKQVDDSMKDTVQGYIVFKSADSVAKALEKNSTIVLDGHHIRVDRATPTVEPSRSVFCGNLPYGTDESTLQEHFEKGCDFKEGDVQGVRIIRDKTTYQCKGFGYILLKEKSMVPSALKLHGSIYMKKQLRVLVCGKRFKGQKGENVPKHKVSVIRAQEKVSVGAFRRILVKQTADAVQWQKRKRGERKKNVAKKAAVGVSKRAALDKKVDKRVKKLQKRASKGMGKARK